MNEYLLQFIWQFKLYDFSKPLITSDGEEAIVMNCGKWNKDAGPDFIEAKIKLGNTLWVGNIEIHIKSSDWHLHKHAKNKAYNNLIMHVVFEHDKLIITQNKSHFPTIELKKYINPNLLNRYHDLMNQKQFIPCSKFISAVNEMTIREQMDRMLTERLEMKVHHINDLLFRFQHNWQEVFYIELARAFGIHINQDAFEQLVLQTPLNIFTKHKNNLTQIEALLFGQAGFLYDYLDEKYPIQLANEYKHLKNLHNLHGLDKGQWKFLRLRPANFPTIRLAQFAQLLHQSNHLFSKVIEATSLKEIIHLFSFEVSDFWLSHYTLTEKSVEKSKNLGKNFIHILTINCIVPMVFIYGKLQGKEVYCEKAINWLREIPAEKNTQITQWISLNMPIKTAEDSQALLHLKKFYCDKMKCLQCSIGYSILKKNH
jgi:hypothetical protein